MGTPEVRALCLFHSTPGSPPVSPRAAIRYYHRHVGDLSLLRRIPTASRADLRLRMANKPAIQRPVVGHQRSRQALVLLSALSILRQRLGRPAENLQPLRNGPSALVSWLDVQF